MFYTGFCRCMIVVLLTLQVKGEVADDGPTIYSLHIFSDIRFRFATTLISSRIANPSNESTEVIFDVNIPSSAFICNFSMNIGDKVYRGKVTDLNSGQNEYEEIKEKGLSGGHVLQEPNEINKFKVKVSVTAQSKVSFNLTYQEVLQRRLGSYNHEIYITPRHPVRDLQVKVAIQELRKITDVSIPPINNDIVGLDIKGKNKLVTVDRPTSTSAIINFKPNMAEQADAGIGGRFTVQYDVERDFSGGEAYILDGYFIHFFAPEVEEPLPRDVLFMIDISTSMNDYKLGQLKDALTIMLGQLRENDHFNLLLFETNQKFWSDTLQPATKGIVSKAIRFVKDLRTKGYSHIVEAFEAAMKHLREQDREGLPMIFFMSDGIMQPSQIVSRQLRLIKGYNTENIPVYSLSFGSGADWNFLHSISFTSGGIARRIYEGPHASLQMSKFFEEVSHTLLNDVTIKPLNIATNNLINIERNYLEGSEIILAGSMNDTEITELTLDIHANSKNGKVNFVLQPDSSASNSDIFTNMPTGFQHGNIIERSWAYLTIKEYLKISSGLTGYDLRRNNQKAEILAKKYGFVTPVTSIIVGSRIDGVWKEYEQDYNELMNRKPVPTIKPPPTRPPRRFWGGGGGGGGGWGGGGGDPHFMIVNPGVDFPICFDIGTTDESYNIFHDPDSGVTVNTKLRRGMKSTTHGTKRVYIKEAVIIDFDQVFHITHDGIESRGITYDWDTALRLRVHDSWLIVEPTRHIFKLIYDVGVEVKILRITHKDRNKIGDDYINVEILREKFASKLATGVVGQFNNKNISLARVKVRDGGKIVGHLQLWNGEQVSSTATASLVTRPDPVQRNRSQCWKLRQKGIEDFVKPKEFLVEDLFDSPSKR